MIKVKRLKKGGGYALIYCDRKTMNFPAIYRLEYKPAKLSYIGQTICLSRRLGEHRRAIDSPDSDCLWVRILRSRYGKLSFKDDFDVYILDYLDDCGEFILHDELSRLEIARIKEYDTWDPTFTKGLNYMPGGAPVKPISRTIGGAYYRTYRSSTNNIRNTCLAYNVKTKKVRMFLSISSAAKFIGTSTDNIKRGYYSNSLVLKTYIILSTSFLKRVKAYDKYINKQLACCNDGDSSLAKTTAAAAAIKHIDAFIDVENILKESYDKGVSRSDYADIISTLSLARHKFKCIYNCNAASELRINETLIVDEEDSVAIYDSVDSYWLIAPSLRAAGRIIGIRRKHILEYARTFVPYAGRYYIYYMSNDIRKEIYGKQVSRKIAKNEAKLLWDYIAHYHELNKIVGVKTIQISTVDKIKNRITNQ